MKYPVSDYPRHQEGAALVIALLIFSLATALVVAMQKEFTLFLARSTNQQVAEQASAYLRGGEELAATVLRRDLLDDKEQNQARDDESEIWAQDIAPYALDEGGWLVGSLEDLQGRFNLNSLLTSQQGGQPGGESGEQEGGTQTGGKRFTPQQEQFIRLLQTLPDIDLDERTAMAITESVIDWIDADNETRREGAEDGFYYDRVPPYRAANRKMISVSELRGVANVTPKLYLALEPLVTVWGDSGGVNIHTAPAEVLRSLNSDGDLAPLNEEEGEALLELRGEDGFENLEEMLESPVFADRTISAEVRGNLGEASNYFLFRGQVDVADRITRLYSVLHRNDDGGVKALVRTSGSL